MFPFTSAWTTCQTSSREAGKFSCFDARLTSSLHWRHNDYDGVSNHQSHGCLLNRLFRRRSKKTSKIRVTGLCAGNSPVPVNSPHKGPVTRKMLPFNDVIMTVMRTRHACDDVIVSCPHLAIHGHALAVYWGRRGQYPVLRAEWSQTDVLWPVSWYGCQCLAWRASESPAGHGQPPLHYRRHPVDGTSEDEIMITSSNGNIFRVSGPVWGESSGHRWIPLTKASEAELWYFLRSAFEQNRDAGDLRRHCVHYDVTVMCCDER